MKANLSIFTLFIFLSACQVLQREKDHLFIPKNIVIAHRGTTYWAPEETEMAYRWARDRGAHYLEVDIQRSRDGVLLALHDEQLTRTTNIEEVFPERINEHSSQFSFEELMQLDAGAWFVNNCESCPKEIYQKEIALRQTDEKLLTFNEDTLPHQTFSNQKVFIGGGQGISTLEDVIRIAEGYRIAKDSLGNRLYKKIEKEGSVDYVFFYVRDTEESGHRPGVYLETKEPHLFPGVERDLFEDLSRLKWNILSHPCMDSSIIKDGHINIGKTSAKVILQTFSPESLKELYPIFQHKIPTCFLLWLGDANMVQNDSLSYAANLSFAKEYGAQIIGPSIAGEPNNYEDLLTEQHFQWIRNQGLFIHPYSFDSREQMIKYGLRCDGMFTNRADLSLQYYSKYKDSKSYSQ